MQRKFWLILIGLVLAVSLLTVSAFAMETVGSRQDVIQEENIVWKLANARVLDLGKKAVIEEGTLITGYTIEADAVSLSKSLLAKGKFRISLTAFSPTRDMPGQKAGMWYVVGEWTITDSRAEAAILETRHNPAVLKGRLIVELPYNPTELRGRQAAGLSDTRAEIKAKTPTFEADIRMPLAPNAGRWAKGHGKFSGTTLFEGTLTLDARLWPELEGWTK